MSVPARSKMFRRRMPSTQPFLLTDGLNNGPIKFECRYSGTSRRADTNDARAVPSKMQPPRIASRIEQTCFASALRVASGQFCPLAQRTRDAGKRQIVQGSFAVGIKRSNMVNVKGRLLPRLGQTAILTTILRPLNDQTPQMRGNGHRFTCRSTGWRATEATSASQPGRPIPRLRAVRQPSIIDRFPVYPGGNEDASRLLSAGETAPDRQAFPVSFRWLESYSSHFSGRESNKQTATCPNIARENHKSEIGKPNVESNPKLEIRAHAAADASRGFQISIF